jgi:hypothetical protein
VYEIGRVAKGHAQTGLLEGDPESYTIEAPRSPRRASTANRQNHWRQAEPAGNALAFAAQNLIALQATSFSKYEGVTNFQEWPNGPRKSVLKQLLHVLSSVNQKAPGYDMGAHLNFQQ